MLRLIARGPSNAELAAEITVAETTVKTHVARILSELRSPHPRPRDPGPGQRAGSTTVIPATVARSNTGSRAAASSRPTVRSTSRCGCSDPRSTSAIIAG